MFCLDGKLDRMVYRNGNGKTEEGTCFVAEPKEYNPLFGLCLFSVMENLMLYEFVFHKI